MSEIVDQSCEDAQIFTAGDEVVRHEVSGAELFVPTEESQPDNGLPPIVVKAEG